MNKVALTGRLTKDPDVRYSTGENQMCIARFSLAVNRRGAKKDGERKADFPSCVAFGKTGEFIEKYARKGMKFDITGRIQTGSYTNKDGNTVYTTDVVVEEIEFGESKGSSSQPKPESEPTEEWVNVPDDVDDELPFN